MPELTFLEALNQALHQEMEADERVFVTGEDVGKFGGAFKGHRGPLPIIWASQGSGYPHV